MKTISIPVIVYTLTDFNDNTVACVVQDYGDTVTYSGIGSDGQRHIYDGYEGIHSYDWAEQRGMKVNCYTKTIDLNIE